jgi:hypothetical protein
MCPLYKRSLKAAYLNTFFTHFFLPMIYPYSTEGSTGCGQNIDFILMITTNALVMISQQREKENNLKKEIK